jgi:hypothetical protein
MVSSRIKALYREYRAQKSQDDTLWGTIGCFRKLMKTKAFII